MIKVLIGTLLFFVLGYMISFIDYYIRLVNNNSIIYTFTLFVLFTVGTIYMYKINGSNYYKSILIDYKNLLALPIAVIFLDKFYDEFYLFLQDYMGFVLLYLMFALVCANLFIGLITRLSKKEKIIFMILFICIIFLNIIAQLITYEYQFNLVLWITLGFESIVLLLLYYLTSKFIVLSSSLKKLIHAYMLVFIIFGGQSLFAIFVVYLT